VRSRKVTAFLIGAATLAAVTIVSGRRRLLERAGFEHLRVLFDQDRERVQKLGGVAPRQAFGQIRVAGGHGIENRPMFIDIDVVKIGVAGIASLGPAQLEVADTVDLHPVIIDDFPSQLEPGGLSLCATEAELADARRADDEGRLYQSDAKMIGPDEIRTLVPGTVKPWLGAHFAPSDGRAEPALATPAIAESARDAGAYILTGCAVRGVETTGGAVSGVVTEKGAIACQSVVLAGGVWSRLMCHSLGIRLPQLNVQGNVMRTAPLDGGPEVSVRGRGFGLRKRLDGGYNIAYGLSNEAQIVPDSFRYLFDFLPRLMMERNSIRLRVGKRFFQEMLDGRKWAMDEVSPFERTRILDPKVIQSDMDAALRNLRAAFPVFDKAQIVESWGGLIDATPDAVPVISAIDELPGFFLSTGYSGHGFGIGPGAGRLTAELVMGEPTVVDPAPFSFNRLSKGSKPVLKQDLRRLPLQ
jgi:glycine/D-amino acid oxidase-like deaminating enzyme